MLLHPPPSATQRAKGKPRAKPCDEIPAARLGPISPQGAVEASLLRFPGLNTKMAHFALAVNK